MAARSYFSDEECRAVGFSPPMIETLKKVAELADTITRLGTVETAADTLNNQIEDANLSLTSLDGRLDSIEALQPFVRQDQGAAWTAATGTEARTALAAYAGQTVSNPPTQAEVQAIDDALKAVSQHVVALINDLRGNGGLNG